MITSRVALREYAGGHSEYRIAQQNPFRTTIGAAAGEPPRGAAYQHQRPEAILCNCRCLGALAAAAVPVAENSLPAGAAALPLGPGAATLRHPAGARRADRQYSIFTDCRTRSQGSRLGLGALAIV